MSDDDDQIRVSAGYPLAQLLRVLEGKGERTEERVAQWREVLEGLLAGILRLGSRTPVNDVPEWVTLEVVHGGFATGKLAAAGPLQAHEALRLASLRRGPTESERATLNLHALGDGGAELVEMLASGHFRIHVPEEGALLIAAWLLGRGETDRAARLVETITPFFDRLRFYPVFDERPLRTGDGVYVQTAGEAATNLRAKRPKRAIATMHEAILVWTPLCDLHRAGTDAVGRTVADRPQRHDHRASADPDHAQPHGALRRAGPRGMARAFRAGATQLRVGVSPPTDDDRAPASTHADGEEHRVRVAPDGVLPGVPSLRSGRGVPELGIRPPCQARRGVLPAIRARPRRLARGRSPAITSTPMASTPHQGGRRFLGWSVGRHWLLPTT